MKTSCLALVLALPCFAPVFASDPPSPPTSPPSTIQSPLFLPVVINPPSARQVRQWERQWQKRHRKAQSSSQWALSYDIVEVVTSTTSLHPPLPYEALQRDPQAEISRLAITQVVDKAQHYQQTVFADITTAYLLEVVVNPPKKEEEKGSTSVTDHLPVVYAYSLTSKGMVQAMLPPTPTTQGVLDLASTSESLWGLVHANPASVTVVQWDSTGRPRVAVEKNSQDKDYIFYSYKEEAHTPYLLQTAKSLNNGAMKATTVLIHDVSAQFEGATWQREDVIKSAALVYLVP